MKVLYIGNYKDGTGWSHAAHENILALDAAGVDVVPRPFKLNDEVAEVSPKIIELESKSDKDCNIVIQNCLPHHTDYNGYFDKNIAYYFTETSHFRNSTWAERLNLLDEAWVPCNDVVKASKNSYVKIPMNVVPVPCDVQKYQKKYDKLDMPHLKGRFSFYTIGEINKRKNLVALIKAFHLEFGPTEPVELVIKGNIPGMSPQQVDAIIGNDANRIKDDLRLYKRKETYLSETIIAQHLSEEQMMQLHNTCDCYVSTSFGEGWNMPAFDAMAMGKTPICTNQGGPKDFIENGGWLVESQPEPVFGMHNNIFDIYMGNEEWEAINIRELRRTMRLAFEDDLLRKKKAEEGIQQAYKYSHFEVGNKMKELLEK